MTSEETNSRLREVRQACDLGHLTADNLDQFWVDTDPARDPHQSVRQVVRLKLEDKEDVRILFYGHGGSAVRQALPKNRRLLFIVEDLDKLDIATARKVFVERPNVLTGIKASIIYTIPIFTFHSPDAGILRNQFDQDVSLPMVKVAEPDGTRAGGFEIVKTIIEKRIGADALTREALELLVKKTGGVLQHAFEVLETAALMKEATIPLDELHIRYGLQRKKNEFWSEITLPFTPIPRLEKKEQLYDRLAECAQRQRQGAGSHPTGDAIDQVLLKACALVEYNGKRWFGVHPLVQEILEDLGRI